MRRVTISLRMFGDTRLIFQLLMDERPLATDLIEVGACITLRVESITHVAHEGTSILRADCVLHENPPGYDPLGSTGRDLVDKTRKLLNVADNVRKLEVVNE